MSVVPLYPLGLFSLATLAQQRPIMEEAVSTGWPELDAIWKIYPGQFTAVTGLAGHGKSTFVFNVMCQTAKKNGNIWFCYVPENEGHLRSKLQRIWGDAPGFVDFSKRQCFVQSCWPEHYDQKPKTLQWILDRAVYAVEQHDAEIILVDPWNEVERAKPKEMPLTDYIGECLVYMKQFARAFGVSVIIIGHPTKDAGKEKRTPTLYDIEGSAHWVNKCDNGLIVWREKENSTTCEVISTKVRELGAGKRGTCYFNVDQEREVFSPL